MSSGLAWTPDFGDELGDHFGDKFDDLGYKLKIPEYAIIFSISPV
ncbi:hypothetical protein AVEN_125229-1, partial [Araneus ventricosus]